MVLTVLVPDGSWDCARALVRDLQWQATRIAQATDSTCTPQQPLPFADQAGGDGGDGSGGLLPQLLRCVRLCDARVAAHESRIISALRAGAGQGRPSTLEACALFLAEQDDAAFTTGLSVEAEVASARFDRVLRGMRPLVAHIERQTAALVAASQVNHR